ncbi:flagellar hook-associated protein FlgL [Comamonas sp. w2-DMI]|uniref:Flagellar hook-associated protein FlgL n=1 Tax=Comamonas terrae TaxID=673548 RepID=A0ABW5UJ71_9BURK|nr:flagellar hook-associated protein FlgL [Comamonas terrae]
MNTIARLGTANMYDGTLRNIGARQSDLADLINKATAGKRVLRPSDDPVGAAQAERARTRITRSETDQRMLGAQRDIIAQGESILGKAYDTLGDFRERIIQAGNGSYDQDALNALAQQLSSLRDQVFSYANTKDASGLPLFRGLGSFDVPIANGSPGSVEQLQPGQSSGGENGLPTALDGHAAWFSVPKGNGVFSITRNAAPGSVSADIGSVTDPSLVKDNYTIAFTKDPVTGAVTYTTTNMATNVTSPPSPYTSGAAITVGGMSVAISGEPATGDSFTLAPNQNDPTDLFSVLDQVIADVKAGRSDPGRLQSGLKRGLSELDAGMSRMQAVRSFAGDQLNRADRLESDMKDQALTQEGLRSQAEDMDMVQAISDAQVQQAGLQAALQSYASIQKLSLFNYIS